MKHIPLALVPNDVIPLALGPNDVWLTNAKGVSAQSIIMPEIAT